MKKESKYYVFGDSLGKFMNSFSLKFQYESSMMGLALILLSLAFYIVYNIFFATNSWYWRGFAIFNCLCGIFILWSQLLTTLNQYVQYREIADIQEEMKGGNNGKTTI